MSELPMRGHFRYLRFKTFPMTPKKPQCKLFWALLSSFEHSGVPEDSKSPTFPSVGLHPHTWPKWGCDNLTHHDPDSGEATTFPHIVFSASHRGGYIRMVLFPETPKLESRNYLGLESRDFGRPQLLAPILDQDES